MANLMGSGFARWDTADATAAFDGTNGPRAPQVTQIRFESGATGGTTTLTVDGKTYFSATIPASSIVLLPFAAPTTLRGLKMTAVGTNVVCVVSFI